MRSKYTPDGSLISVFLERLVVLHDLGKYPVIQHLLPLLDRLIAEHWLTDEEQEFVDELKNLQ